MNKLNMLTLLVLLSINTFAQTGFQSIAPIEMADGLYQSGKIYVVIGVISIIFTGIIIYLISIDRKVSKLEKEIKNK